jgi:hypothetical protein
MAWHLFIRQQLWLLQRQTAFLSLLSFWQYYSGRVYSICVCVYIYIYIYIYIFPFLQLQKSYLTGKLRENILKHVVFASKYISRKV